MMREREDEAANVAISIALEVIATSATDVVEAARGGADRIELVADLRQGGLTPDRALVAEAVRLSPIPVRVMIRPHARSFRYDRADLAAMRADIAAARAAGAAGLVFGALAADGRIDRDALEALLAAAGDTPVTFHRAFDDAADVDEALETLLAYPTIDRLLTSGGVPSAVDGAATIVRLVRRISREPGSKLRLLAGSGLTPETLAPFLDATGVREVHFGRAARRGSDVDAPVDAARVRAIKTILTEWARDRENGS